MNRNSKKLLLFWFALRYNLGSHIYRRSDGAIFTHCYLCFYVPYVPNNLWGGFGRAREDTSLGAAGLVMAIVGGALMPPLQGLIIDKGTIGSFAAVNVSFVLPLICFCVVATYGFRAFKKHGHPV